MSPVKRFDNFDDDESCDFSMRSEHDKASQPGEGVESFPFLAVNAVKKHVLSPQLEKKRSSVRPNQTEYKLLEESDTAFDRRKTVSLPFEINLMRQSSQRVESQ